MSRKKKEDEKEKTPIGPCDWPGCKDPWVFVHLKKRGEYGVLRRRCRKHWNMLMPVRLVDSAEAPVA